MENISVRAIARERAVSKMGLNPFSWYREMRENDPVHFDAHAQIWDWTRQKCLVRRSKTVVTSLLASTT